MKCTIYCVIKFLACEEALAVHDKSLHNYMCYDQIGFAFTFAICVVLQLVGRLSSLTIHASDVHLFIRSDH